MANSEVVQVQGLDQLSRALKELPDRVARNGLRASVYAGAKVIRDEARLKAPVAIAALGPDQPPPGTLKRSVIMKQIPELSGKSRQTFFVTVRHGKKYRKQGKKGNLSQDAWYWRFVEFGTVKMAARPFLRPAFDLRKNDALDAIKTRLAERIEQAVQELGS
jgi:HK97 gp10 family phage protein